MTWKHHLQQTSEWEGNMWGKNDDFVGHEQFGEGERKPRERQRPGTYYEYNDVRINRLGLSLLRVFKKPVPEVFRDEIMDPIGASNAWKWVPYHNSYVDIDGKRLPSVSGGTRWGGGVWINSWDMSKWLAKMSVGAKVIDQPRSPDEQWLFATVRHHAEAAGIGMPEIAIYDAPDMNAFATGMSRNHALVAVSTGLLRSMRAMNPRGTRSGKPVSNLGKRASAKACKSSEASSSRGLVTASRHRSCQRRGCARGVLAVIIAGLGGRRSRPPSSKFPF